MRIEIDATPLLLRSAGIKNYFYYWIRHLRRIAGEDSISAFPFLGEFGGLNHEASVLNPWATWPRLGLLYFINYAPAVPVMDWIASRADVIHLSNQVRHPPRRTPLTATIHDMTCWRMPQFHTGANVKADKTFAERVFQKAAGLIAVSENTKKDAVEILDLDPDKVEVIYSGIAGTYFNTHASGVQRAAARYGLDKPYILFVGTIEPRKNIDTLLDAYEALPESVRTEVDLVVAGPAGWRSEATRRRLESQERGVRYLRYVPEDDLPSLMAGATVFAYLSWYEGFGFPVAQAMACGAPVLVSNVSSLPEVAGGAGLTVDPNSVSEAASALDRLLTTPSLRDELSARGKARAQRYRWEECARQSLEFFRRAANR